MNIYSIIRVVCFFSGKKTQAFSLANQQAWPPKSPKLIRPGDCTPEWQALNHFVPHTPQTQHSTLLLGNCWKELKQLETKFNKIKLD